MPRNWFARVGPARQLPFTARPLKGLYEHDPNLLLGLAVAQFESGALGRRTCHAGFADRA